MYKVLKGQNATKKWAGSSQKCNSTILGNLAQLKFQQACSKKVKKIKGYKWSHRHKYLPDSGNTDSLDNNNQLLSLKCGFIATYNWNVQSKPYLILLSDTTDEFIWKTWNGTVIFLFRIPGHMNLYVSCVFLQFIYILSTALYRHEEIS